MGMEIGLYRGFVGVVILDIVPIDAGKHRVIGHSGGKSEIIEPKLQGVRLREVAVFDFIQFQRGKSRVSCIEIPQFQVIEVKLTELYAFRAHRQVKRIVPRSEGPVKRGVFGDFQRWHQKLADGFGILQIE